MAAPANDNIASRQVLSGDSGSITPITIDDATTESGEPAGSDVSGINQSVWFEWTAPASGLATFTTEGSVATDGNGDPHGGLDTTLAAWTGDPTDFSSLIESASDDDDSSLGSGHYTSKIRFPVVGGTTYYIQVGTFDTPYAGTMHLSWSRVDLVLVGPENDSCANAHELAGTSGHVEATNIGWAGTWTIGDDPLFNKLGHGGGAPLFFKYTNAGSAPVELVVTPAVAASPDPVSRINLGLAVGTCGTLDIDTGDGFDAQSQNFANPASGSPIDVFVPAGETAYLEIDSYTGDGSEPPDASGAEGSFAFDWSVTTVSTRDCMTTQVALGDTRASQSNMAKQVFDSCGFGIGGDGTQALDSILVGDKVYVAYQLDYFGSLDPPPTCTGHSPHRTARVASVNTDGTGYVEAVVFDTPVVAYGHGATKGSVQGSEGNLTGGGGGSTNTGTMFLAYDGHDVLLAVLTITGAFGGFLNYHVDIYREDAGAWTNIATLTSEDLKFTSLEMDSFESFRIAASPSGPRKLWVGLIYAYIDNNTGLPTDRFTRYEIDTSTGGVTTLYDDFDNGGGAAATINDVGAVGTAHWWIEADEGYPILLWQKHSGFDTAEANPAFNGRTGWDGFLTAERFDTKALIREIHRSELRLSPGDGFDGTGTPAVTDDKPLDHGSDENAFLEIRTGDTLKMFARFFCGETGQYERFISLRGWSDFYTGGGSLSSVTRSLIRVKSDLSDVLENIDSLTFNTAPSVNGNAGFSSSQRHPWAVTTPLYDGTRNVWTIGDALSLSGSPTMFQYDRRCSHDWLSAMPATSDTWEGDLWQRGGWDADLYFYLIGNDMQIWKLGPVERDCVACIPISPLVAGLYAWQKF